MAENETQGVSSTGEQAFKTTSGAPLDATIKQGIHDLFVHAVALSNASGEQAKLEIAEALRVLVNVDPSMEHEEQADCNSHYEGVKILIKYFCIRRGGLVEVYVSSESNSCEVKVTDKDGAIKIFKPALSQKTKNGFFQMAVLKFFDAPWISEVGKMTLTGVLVALSEREHLGRFEDVFKKHHALFGKLSKVYEKATVDALLFEGGEVSPCFAVDTAVEIIEREEWKAAEIEKEQDAMMREG